MNRRTLDRTCLLTCFLVLAPLPAVSSVSDHGSSLADDGRKPSPLTLLRQVSFEEAGIPGTFQVRGLPYSVTLQPDRVALESDAGDRSQPALTIMGLQDANPRAPARLEGDALGRIHYLLGRHERAWRRDVAWGQRLRFSDAWPGIDVVHHATQGRLEVDFELTPGSDPARVQFVIGAGAEPVIEAGGALCIDTAAGPIRWLTPFAYQESADCRQPVACEFVLAQDRNVGFLLGDYDRDRPLIIDPVLAYSSFFGGEGEERILAIEVDDDGTIVVAGHSSTADLSVGGGVYQPSMNDILDCFVARLSPTGDEILWLTYLGGGDNNETLADMAIAPDGSIHLLGTTGAPDFPLVDAFQTEIDDGHASPSPGDAFLARLSADGAELLFSSYLGGASGSDRGLALAVDADGSSVIAGKTTGELFPTQDALYPSVELGEHGWVARVLADGDLQFATLLPHFRNVEDVALQSDGSIVLTGDTTHRGDFPITGPRTWENPRPCSPGATCHAELVVMRLRGDGQELLRSFTMSGARDGAGGNDLVIDPADGIHVLGHYRADDFPLVDAFQGFGGHEAGTDALWLSFDSTAEFLTFSSFIGPCQIDRAVMDETGAMLVAGWTYGAHAQDHEPVAAGPAHHPGEWYDTCAIRVPAERTGVDWALRIGGTTNPRSVITFDGAAGLAVAGEDVWLAGYTNSSDFPLVDPMRDVLEAPDGIGELGEPNEGFLLRLTPHVEANTYEPSAMDARPWVQALSVARPSPSASSVTIGWEETMGGDGRYTLLRGSLSSLSVERGYDHEVSSPCGLSENSYELAMPSENSYFLVVGEKAGSPEPSSLGRDSRRIERPQPAEPCF